MARSILSCSRIALLTFAALAFGAGCAAEVIPADESDLETAGNEQERTAADPCEQEGDVRSCVAPGDPRNLAEGSQTCAPDEDNELQWTECNVAPPSSGSTPLVLSFDGAPVEFRAGGASTFDLTGSMSVATDWPTASTPWLALDRNGNGSIDDGSELFGSATKIQGGELATNGFQALRELDTDGDGRITPADAGWSKLAIWSDRDGDRFSSTSELAPLGSRKLLSLELGYTTAGSRCDLRGNCEIERAGFRYADESGVERTGTIVDVHLKFQ
jgi:hypothetical protein